jgi:DNA-binding NarL/FixJ family response regulator
MKKNNHLTRKQQQVLVLSAQGYLGKEIAELLNISLKGVISRKRQVCLRLGAKNTAHAVYLAGKRGLLG